MVACYDRAQLRLSERLSEDGLLTALTVARVAGETTHQANVRSGRCLVCERRRRARSGEGAGLMTEMVKVHLIKDKQRY